MSYIEIQKHAFAYMKLIDHQARKDIIINVWIEDGSTGLTILAELLGYPYDYLYTKGNLEIFRQERNRKRRGRNNAKKAEPTGAFVGLKELAVSAAGGGLIASCGGQRSTYKSGNGNVKSASFAQSMLAQKGQ